MDTYHKIPSLWKRQANKPHAVLPGQYKDPNVCALVDHEWVWSEKIDGTNVRVFWDGYKVAYGGRTDNAQFPPDLKAYLQSLQEPEFEQVLEQTFGGTPVQLFAEGVGPKVQSSDWYLNDTGIILFDVRINGVWLEPNTVSGIASNLGLPRASIHYFTSLPHATQFVEEGLPSAYDLDREAEGLVGVPLGGLLDRKGQRIVVKLKAKDLKDPNESA